MALSINQNVLIVPVLDLEDVAGERVGSQALAEGVLGALKSLALGVATAEFVYKELVERGIVTFVDFIKAH